MKHADMDAFLYLQGANKELRTLRLSTNRMESLAVESLGRKLPTKSWPLLQNLDLSFNTLDYRAVSALVDGVLRITSLRTLRLSGCKINSSTSPVISRLISQDTRIVELDLSFNMLNQHGAEDIAQALEINRTLTILNLRSNNLGPAGGLLIVNSLIKNKTIRELSLVDNKIGNQVATLLSGRLSCGMHEILSSFRADELNLPPQYSDSK